MSDVLAFVAIFLGLYVAVLLVYVVIRLPGVGYVSGLVRLPVYILWAPFAWIATASHTHREEKELEEELSVKYRVRSRRPKNPVAAAAEKTRLLHILDTATRTAVGNCLHSHQFAAQFNPEATHMAEVAEHPVCSRLRGRVVKLLSKQLRELESYPLLLSSPDLTRRLLATEVLYGICSECPYISYPIEELPTVCPTAKHLGIGPLSESATSGEAEEQFEQAG